MQTKRRRCSLERERQLQRKGGELQDLRHTGARVCPPSAHAAQASSASGLTENGATLCTVSRSNSSIIYQNEELGISTANCK